MKKRIISMLLSMFFTLNLILPQVEVLAAGVYVYNGIYNGNCFAVSYEVQNEWEGGKTVRVGIINNGTGIISNWGLKYTESGEITSIWNGEIYAHLENEYIITNIGYNYAVRPGQTVYFGCIVNGNNSKNPEKFEICSKTIEKSNEYGIIFNVTSQWDGGFTADVVLENTSDTAVKAWSVSFDTNCEITNIWNAEITGREGETYTVSCSDSNSVIPADSQVSFGIEAKCTEEVYFENVKMTEVIIDASSGDGDSDDSGENNEEDPENPDDPDETDDPEIDYELDTDSDSLPDYYEEILGTDKENSDTDGDGLNDGYEVLYLGTDTLKADSDENGVSDGEEDPDADGLSNLDECEIGTDPANPDTDSDGLSDGAEKNTHGTDPLRYDSDDDSISDGDEISLGLNPSSSATDGTPDSERTFAQIVDSDSDVLAAVNDDAETPFEVSLEIKAAGVAENNVYARESGYSNAIENTAVIGIAPEFVYTEGLEVEEVTVKFELDDSVVNNTLGTYTASSGEFEGIKRLNVFMFFEEINMLLPVETFHDEATNTVYTTTDRMGTYCLMDVEIWLSNLGIEPIVENSVEKAEFSSGYSSITKNAFYSTPNSYKDNFDVAFLIDSRINSHEKFIEIKKSILDICDIIFNVSPNARVRFVQLMPVERSDINFYQAITDDNGNEFCTDYYAVNDALAKVEQLKNIEGIKKKDIYDSCNVRPGLMHVLKSEPTGKYAYCFYILEKSNSVYDPEDVNTEAGESIEPTISISVVSDYEQPLDEKQEDYAYIPQLCENTSGIISSYENAYTDCLTEIYGKVPVLENAYKAIIATGYQTVVLDAPITENYETAYKFVEQNPDSIAFYGDYANTDKDGLKDFQEIMYGFNTLDADGNSIGYTQLIKWDDNGNAILPKYEEIYAVMQNKLYIERGLERYCNVTGESAYNYIGSLEGMNILTIIADPINEDGDGDGLLDGEVFIHEERAIAPQDPNPLTVDGPAGMWKTHIENVITNDIPSEFGDWYGEKNENNNTSEQSNSKVESIAEFMVENSWILTQSLSAGISELDNSEIIEKEWRESTNWEKFVDLDEENSGIEGIMEFENELNRLVEEGTVNINIVNVPIIVGIAKVSLQMYFYKIINEYQLIQSVIQGVKKYAVMGDNDTENEVLARLGSRLLNFKADTSGEMVHSQMRTWQAIGGYSNLYDNVFETFTDKNMSKQKFVFTDGKMDYVLWVWRGDYLNLGAGAEMGIYKRSAEMTKSIQQSEKLSSLDQYFTDYDLSMPMSLYLYDYTQNQDKTIEINNLISWEPETDQWWITGFNPSTVGKADVKKQVMIGCVDFSQFTDENGDNEMYNAFITSVTDDITRKKYIVLDDKNTKVWICWYEVF